MTPLEAGLAAMDLYLADNKGQNDAMIVRHRVRAMLRAHAAIWSDDADKYEVLAVENLRLAPLKSLVTGRDSGYIAAGKIDLVVREKTGRKQVIIVDNKNLSDSLDDSRIEHLLIDGQGLQYGYLEFANGVKADQFMYNVLVKTTHRPYKATAKKPAETLEEFEERLLANYLEEPGKFFARPIVPLLKENIANHLHETYLWAKELDIDCNSDTHLRNPGACFEWQRPCKYLGICSGRSHETDGTWKKKDQTHVEIELPAGVDPLKILTNSRLKLFRTCRLKHYRQYVQGLDRIKEDHNEALAIGTLSHVGLEHYWKAIASLQ